MIIRVPKINEGDITIEFNEIPVDIDFRFIKGYSKKFTDSIARFIEMGDILPDFCKFGGIILIPGSQLSDVEYSISPFRNILAIKEEDQQYTNYKSISDDRQGFSFKRFKQRTTYKVSANLMNFYSGFYYKSIVIQDDNSKSKITYDGHLIVNQSEKIKFENQKIQPGKDFLKWKERFKDVKEELKLMIGIPIYLRTVKVFPFAFIWLFCFEPIDSENTIFKDITSENKISFKRYFIDWLNDLSLLFSTLSIPLSTSYINNTIVHLEKSLLKTAIISILVDSYAHNISAHSLAALKWWIELRHKMLDKRFSIPVTLGCLNPCQITRDQSFTKETTKKYYEALGLEDSTYNEKYLSLFDYLQFIDKKSDLTFLDLFTFNSPAQLLDKDGEELYKFHPRFPVPVDHALYPFFRFLRDKGAFWSGVTRDMAFGGESKTWYKILWEDFANNPLYLGSIAKTEGITKININLAVKINGQWASGRFVRIDLSVMDYEEKTIKNEELRLEYSLEDNSLIRDFINNSHEEPLKKYFEGFFEKSEFSVLNNLKEYLNKIIDEIENKIENDGYKNRLSIINAFIFEYDSVSHIYKKDKEKKKKLLKIFDKIIEDIYLKDDYKDTEICEIENSSEHKLKNDCNDSNAQNVEFTQYSKYAFVKLGRCFKHFRKILDKNEYEVFLPGGLVGEHALFTIFENTIRNIKHYRDNIENIKKSGLDFWIALEPSVLEITDPDFKRDDGKPNELFKVYVWLGHKTSLFELDEKGGLKETLWGKVTDRTIRSILDNNGAPIMGGSSQDKSCCAMLFNNYFSSVEFNTEIRDRDYFPWIHFCTSCDEINYMSEKDKPFNVQKYHKLNDKKKNAFKNEYFAEINKNTEGYLKKYFYLWKAADWFIIKAKSDLTAENVSRFKFVLISDDISNGEKDEIIYDARKKGIIRLLFNKDVGTNKYQELINEIKGDIFNKNEKLKKLYLWWLQEWIKYDNHFSLRFESTGKYCSIDININNFKFIRQEDSKKIGDINITLSHGGINESISCNVRSHGAFWSKYFDKAENKDPNDLVFTSKPLPYDIDKDYLLLDLIEVLATKIVIFDNRVNERMPKKTNKRGEVFKNQLRLFVSDETPKEKSINKKHSFKEILDKICKSPNILVVHLTYIESLGYSEENINSFIDNEISHLFNDNFVFVITTGRGRITWREKLSDKYKERTIFKPVETLLTAVESGISYNDNFDVKFNLIKAIFGS